MVLQIILVFAMIGVLGLLLRWAFARDKRSPQWPATQPAETRPTETRPTETHPADTRSAAAASAAAGFVADPQPSAAEAAAGEAPVEREDYGLLAEAAAVPTSKEAERIKARLGAVGIRATTTVGRDGRHRVLVFASEIHRARRVAGGSSS